MAVAVAVGAAGMMAVDETGINPEFDPSELTAPTGRKRARKALFLQRPPSLSEGHYLSRQTIRALSRS